MFCPGCGFQVSDDLLKFCRQCGANLHSVRNAVTSRGDDGKFDWSKSWWAGMLYSPAQLELMRAETPEEKRIGEEKKRISEIKGGIITGLIGIGVMISFYFFFGAVADASTPKAAEIVSKLWMLGIVPTLIGAGLLINGFFISRRLVELTEKLSRTATPGPPPPIAQMGAAPIVLEAKTTDQLIADDAAPARYSVTEDSTAHLPEPVPAPLRNETN
jgi:hypothetical protein